MTQKAMLNESTSLKAGDAFQLLSVTQLHFASTNAAFEQGKLAYTARDYDRAVQLYTCALADLEADVKSVIHIHRAAAYEMLSKFDQAAQDGRAADTDKNAVQPDSHLTLGSALFLNNQLREAVAVYQRGAKTVPETHPRHNALVENHRRALDYMEKRNQFMAQVLPFEVLSSILSKLSIRDRARLGMTCRFWNVYIFQKWPYMWHTIDTYKDLFGYPKRGARLIDAIRGDQVRKLYAQFDDPERHYYGFYEYNDEYDSDGMYVDNVTSKPADSGVAILDAMYNNGSSSWKHLKSLSLAHCSESQFKKISTVAKNSLHELALRDSKKHNNYGKRMIAMAASDFPKLQLISNHFNTYNGNSWLVDYIRDTAQVSAKFYLTSLSMSWCSDTTMLTSICQYLPALSSLTVDARLYHDYFNLLDAVTQYCPILENLHYKMGSVTDKIRTTYTLQPTTPTKGGLRVLTFRPDTKHIIKTKSSIADAQLTALFQRGCMLLETVDLSLDTLDGTGCTALQMLAQLATVNLKNLSLYASDGSTITSQLLGNLISSCPSLVNIKIDGLNIEDTDDILNALTVTSSIQTVDVNFFTPPNGHYMINSFRHFFQQAKHLHNFSMNSNDGFTPASHFVLQLTKAIGSSFVVILDLGTHEMTSQLFICALTNLKASQIRTLKIRVARFTIDDTVLDALVNIQHLTHLVVFDDQRHFKEDDLCKLFQKWESPQMLVVEVQFKLPQGFLKGYKPDLGTMRQAKEQIKDPKVRYSIVRG